MYARIKVEEIASRALNKIWTIKNVLSANSKITRFQKKSTNKDDNINK